MYVIYWYRNDSEIYILIFRVGISVILIIMGESGVIRLIVIMLI